MWLLNSANIELYLNLSREISRVVARVENDRRTSVLVNPKRPLSELEYEGFEFPKKYLDLTALIILSWYSNVFEEFSAYLRSDIQQYLERNCLFPELDASLNSKEAILFMIMWVPGLKSRVIFGSCLNPERLQRVLNQTRLRLLRTPQPRYPIRRRGYKDKGSLRHPHQRRSIRASGEDQQRIENRRTAYLRLVTYLRNKVGGLVYQLRIEKQKGGILNA
jgi:hypothetical protein